ncbi:MAG: response regulator [Bacteroidota bacterium]|nr:response regulator [Bacteroidota bacterium]
MILIVDDRPENIFSLKSILELNSFSVDTASSGEIALKKALKHNYELIILDVQMPMMDGFEVAEFLSGNSKTRNTPIIFLSAVNTEKKFITRGYASGAIDYVLKPIDPDILMLKVKTFHRLHEQNNELVSAQKELKSEIEFRIKAQETIQAKATELNGILGSIPQVAFTSTGSGVLDFVNDQWYNYSDSLHKFPETHPEDPAISHQWKNMLSSTDPLQLEIRLAKSGTQDYRYHLLRVLPVIKGGEVIKWVGTFTDIEEQKQILKRKDEFLSIASHELKTPLTSIKAYVQLLDDILADDVRTKVFVSRALLQVNKLDGLINDLLDISKIENGRLTFDFKEIKFEELLATTLEMLAQIYPDIKITHEGETNAKICGNAMRLEQVIINLVSNAVKYSPKGKKVHVLTKITPGNELCVSVKDFGIGISPENQKNIFSKFYRVTDTDVATQGLGIGLYICDEILKRHHSTLTVKSELGKGAEFYFKLPIISEE